MSDWLLYHYYEAAHGPFRNVSALAPEEAERVMHRLKQEGKTFAGKRSDDYLDIRRNLEARARELFIGKGGRPVLPYPHYMTLGPCEWLREWYQDARDLHIPLDAFDPAVISFTYGDLFPTMRYVDGKPYREKLYVKDEIGGIIDQFGWPQEWNRAGAHGPERYIEVQIWDDEAIRPFWR
ncbi:hypothetical protein WMW72_06885 [Paenibacillus filicis]|uniref:Uncharacterized protein n=1 Tax=Paenibacillus filicis TaxID=669464 RepID=A0ABU9DFJ0_9BACL